ncbi:uncharacterized protein LOC125653195 isoform X2 [Ostrea edulis]|uniref:uncharacterized protein LOC125653195 isoform X2 n=1 Tax=Ostrea edulis TaxID=37623 RepID=UPI0024AF82A6|nr:uncharacterized protein LOC125653195 isoform X2 [Ostrea edulis]
MTSDADGLFSSATALLSAKSSSEEQLMLKSIHKHLSNLDDSGKGFQKGDGNHHVYEEICAPHTETQLVALISNDNVLNKLTCYVFDRRYGWSEAGRDGRRRVRKMSSTGTTLEASDGHVKAMLNDLLDNIIKWYIQQPLSVQLIHAFEYTMKQVSDVHVVRNRTIIHFMEWLRENKEELLDFEHIHLIQRLIISAVTDVWSAIRNSCAKNLGPIVSYLPLADQEKIFQELVKLCVSENSPWQAVEGAVMGINSIVQQYTEKADSRSNTPQFCLHSQSLDIPPVPNFISEEIHAVVFELLYHSQLTIREHAAKALSTYISCSDIKEAFSTFEQVIQQLLKGILGPENIFSSVQTTNLPIKFLDAYAAEGLLNVCLSIIKVLPLQMMLSNWPTYTNSFLLYLSHPASTVRQAASSIFKYLVSKCSHCAILVSLLLQSLVQGWIPSMDILQREEKTTDPGCSSHIRASVNSEKGFLLDAWESREGRLLAYELIMKFFIKNHWLYTFGPAASSQLRRQNTESEQLSDDEDNIPEEMSKERTHSISCADELEKMNNVFHESTSEQSLPMKRMFYRKVQFKSEGGLRVIGYEKMNGELGGGKISRYIPLSVLSQLQNIDHTVNNKHQHVSQQFRNMTFYQKLADNLGNKTTIEEDWMASVQLTPLKQTLTRILLQTIESLADSQWELRRITKQVLPCLAEVIRWYDINILEEIWQTHLSPRPSLLTYAAVMLLQESILHCTRLNPLIQRPPATWQHEDSCKQIVQKIVSIVTDQIPSCLPSLDKLVQRSRYDRLSVMTCTTIILAHAQFDIPSNQRVSQIASVLSYWKLLFGFTHPNTRITKELLQQGMDIRLFSSPFEGYLSCCLVKPENKFQCAKQVEKVFISESHRALQSFLQKLPVESISSLMPIIAHCAGLFIEESSICKNMRECLQSVGVRVVEYVTQAREDKQNCLMCLHLTLKELAAIITMKSAEVHLLQKILNIYLILCKPLNPVKHLRSIILALCSRVSEGIHFSVDHSPRPNDDLCILSNDIPLTSTNSSESLSDLDVEDTVIIGSPGHFPESLTLNLSNSSLPSGRISSLSQSSERSGTKSPTDKDSESSDWDSWDDDDNEEQSALTQAFGEFLKKLQKVCDAGSHGVFEAEIKKLDTRERSLIREIMSN